MNVYARSLASILGPEHQMIIENHQDNNIIIGNVPADSRKNVGTSSNAPQDSRSTAQKQSVVTIKKDQQEKELGKKNRTTSNNISGSNISTSLSNSHSSAILFDSDLQSVRLPTPCIIIPSYTLGKGVAKKAQARASRTRQQSHEHPT